MRSHDPGPARSDIGVTVIGGYLGAGKTTLVSRLLEQIPAEGPRLAVLVNDFGEVNIDAARIARRTDDIIELSNGCVCCALVDGFVETLDQIAAWSTPPDHLIIEPSGVADPMSVAQYAFMPGFRLAGVAVAADAVALDQQLSDKRIGSSVRQQLERADLVILTKTDLTTPHAAQSSRSTIATITAAPIVIANEGALDPRVLLGIDGDPSRRRDLSSVNETVSSVSETASLVRETPEPLVTQHVVDVGPMTTAEHRSALESWLTSAPPSVVRVKGILQSADGGELDVDLVGKTLRTTPSITAYASDRPHPMIGHLVVLEIGENTDDGHNPVVGEWLASLLLPPE